MQNTHFDIIIIGGGNTGLFAASIFAQHHYRVAIIDKNTLTIQPQKNTLQARVVALSPKSMYQLQQWGIAAYIDMSRITQVSQMHIKDADSGSALDFNAQENTYLHSIVENENLRQASLQLLAHKYPKTTVFFEQHIPQSITHTPQNANHHISVLNNTTNTTQNLTGQYIVYADGKNNTQHSAFLPIDSPFNQGQYAITAKITVERSHHNASWQWMGDNGIIALLPLADEPSTSKKAHDACVVWTMSANQYSQFVTAENTDISPQFFAKKLAQAYGYNHFGNVTINSPMYAFEVHQHHCQRYFYNNQFIIGDSAHAFLPIAGLGMNRAISDLAQLQIHLQNKQQNFDTWQRHVWLQNQSIMSAMRMIENIYLNQNYTTMLLRNIAMRTMQHSHGLRLFAQQLADL